MTLGGLVCKLPKAEPLRILTGSPIFRIYWPRRRVGILVRLSLKEAVISASGRALP